jgi:hypothetical protein
MGVSAGLALGIYLEKTYNNTTIRFVEGPSLTITTEKSDYALDEPIKIDIINTGNIDTVFSSAEPSLRVRALDGTEFFSTYSDGTTLAPKEKITLTWNQQKNDNSNILEGRYVIESFAFDRNTKIGDSITVNILR